MNNKVEGVYPTVEEALRAVDRLRIEGYARDEIKIIANEETRNRVDSNVRENITSADAEFDQSEEEEKSFWDSIKEAFTMSEPDYETVNPLNEYKDKIERGEVVVMLNEQNENYANTQPNTVGPDGVRDPVTEQKVESMGEYPRVDHELTTDELEDYERKQ